MHHDLPVGEVQVEINTALLADRAEGGADGPDERDDVKIGVFQTLAGFIQRVQGQHALRQISQAVGLPDDDIHILFLLFGRDHAVLHGLQIAADGGEGRAEIVGNIGNELFLRFIGALQLLRHHVQRVGKVADLVAALHGDAVPQVTEGIFLRAVRDRLQRL